MSNRRAFLKAAGGAALACGAFGAYGQAAPKRVTIGGRRVTVVDLHAHCLFPEVASRVPNVRVPRAAPPTLVLGPERIAAMDERGIDIQALSVNTYWWYSASRPVRASATAALNEISSVLIFVSNPVSQFEEVIGHSPDRILSAARKVTQ